MASPTVVAPVVVGSEGFAKQPGLKPGDVLDGKYVLRERIGQGGMGRVFLADQLALARSVAIKVLHRELIGVPDLAHRMHDEAMIACHVRNPHCVEVFDCGVLPDGTPFIVMEFIPGRPLGRIIADQSIPLARAFDVFEQILSALAAIHRCGIVHGDVKSDNFLIETMDGADHVTMIDFGLSQIIGASPDLEPALDEIMISGTPEYMAPEVIAGDPPLPASDLYGAGVILYELLTGTTPFRGGTAMEIMLRHTRDQVIPPSERRPDLGIPPDVDRVVLEALAKHPEARFSDAATFAGALRAAAGASRDAKSRSLAPEDGMTQRALSGDDSTPRSRRRIAPGSDCGGARRGDLGAIREAIAGALRRGDVAAIADGYSELANAFLGQRDVAAAARELQEGIDVLTAGCDPRCE